MAQHAEYLAAFVALANEEQTNHLVAKVVAMTPDEAKHVLICGALYTGSLARQSAKEQTS